METVFLAIIQAFTEFLPVSSTAHLIVLPHLWNIQTAGRLTEVALHLGTLGVVLLYFRKDIWEGIKSLGALKEGKLTKPFHRWAHVAIATLPVVVVGYGLQHSFEKSFRSFEMMGWFSIFFGLLLLVVDHKAPAHKRYETMSYGDAFIIGLLQVIALFPGASRLGTTLIAGRLLGYERIGAARFSFLLSIPAVLGATILLLSKASWNEVRSIVQSTAVAGGLCFMLGYFVLMGFMKWIKHHTFMPFAIYRIAFGLYVVYYSL